MNEQTHAVTLWQSLATVSLQETVEAFYIAARNEGLEEAAIRCDGIAMNSDSEGWAKYIAAEIRELKEKP